MENPDTPAKTMTRMEQDRLLGRKTPLTVMINDDLRGRLATSAAKNGRSVSGEVRYAIKTHTDKELKRG